MSAYQPKLSDLKDCAKEKRHQLARWFVFKIAIGLTAIWIGFVLYPVFASFNVDISPLDGVRNGNIFVFIVALSASSIGLFYETTRGFTWKIAFWNSIALGFLGFVAALYIPIMSIPQAKTSPKGLVVFLSFAMLVLVIPLAMQSYLITLLDQKITEEETIQEEQERKVEALQHKAENLEIIDDIELE